jgi:hypothetical protein
MLSWAEPQVIWALRDLGAQEGHGRHQLPQHVSVGADALFHRVRTDCSQSADPSPGVPLARLWGGGSHSVGLARKSQPTATTAGMATYQTGLPESELPTMAMIRPAKTHADNQASLLTWLGDVVRGGPGTCMACSRAL